MDKQTATVLGLSGKLIESLQDHIATLKELQAMHCTHIDNLESTNDILSKNNKALELNNDLLIDLLEESDEDDEEKEKDPFSRGNNDKL